MKTTLSTIFSLVLIGILTTGSVAQDDSTKKPAQKPRLKLNLKKGGKAKPKAKRLTLRSTTSTALPRLQRSPSGNINDSNFKKGTTPKTLKTTSLRLNKKGSKNTVNKKRLAGTFSTPKKLADTATRKRPSKSISKKKPTALNKKRFGGTFSSPKKLADTATRKRPSKSISKKKPTALNKKRLGGTFSSPKKLADTATSKRPTSKNVKRLSKSPYKTGKMTKAMGGVAAIGLAGSAVDKMKNSKQKLNSGKISKSEYNKLQTKNGVNAAGELYKLKKLNPASMVMNDVVGTDPISLGVDAVGDLINGTDNAKKSLKGVKKAWNGSLTKQAFSDPKGATKRVEKGLEETGKKIDKGLKKAGKNIDKAGKKVGDFFKGAFKKKKKK